MNKRLKNIIYLISIVVLLILGVTIWYMQTTISETKTFIVEQQKRVEFEVSSEIPIPKIVKIKFEGKLDCDALLILKSKNEIVKSRNTFPLQAGILDDKELECKWHSSDFLVEFKSNDCVAGKLKIVLKIVE